MAALVLLTYFLLAHRYFNYIFATLENYETLMPFLLHEFSCTSEVTNSKKQTPDEIKAAGILGSFTKPSKKPLVPDNLAKDIKLNEGWSPTLYT